MALELDDASQNRQDPRYPDDETTRHQLLRQRALRRLSVRRLVKEFPKLSDDVADDAVFRFSKPWDDLVGCADYNKQFGIPLQTISNSGMSCALHVLIAGEYDTRDQRFNPPSYGIDPSKVFTGEQHVDAKYSNVGQQRAVFTLFTVELVPKTPVKLIL